MPVGPLNSDNSHSQLKPNLSVVLDGLVLSLQISKVIKRYIKVK